MVAGSKPVRRLKCGAVPSMFNYSHCMPLNAEDSEVCAAKRLKTVEKHVGHFHPPFLLFPSNQVPPATCFVCIYSRIARVIFFSVVSVCVSVFFVCNTITRMVERADKFENNYIGVHRW